MLIPTRKFWIWVGLGIPLTLVGLVIPRGELILIPYNLLLFSMFLVTGLVAKKWSFIKVKRTTDRVLSVRTDNSVTLEFNNEGSLPIKMKIRDELPELCESETNETYLTLKPDRTTRYTYDFTPKERGASEFPGTFIRYEAPFGLASIQKQLPNSESVRIYPNVKAVQEYEFLKQRGYSSLIGVRKSRVKGLGTEFESLRDYNEDDYRIIDWKASARRGKLVVKNFEQESNQSVIVCVDVGRQMLSEVDGVTKLDLCLDASLMVMHAAERSGDQVGLLVFNDVIKRFLLPKKGRQQTSAILDTIYDARAEAVQSNYLTAFSYLASRWKKRSLVVVFTDAEDIDQASDLAGALSQISRRHLVLIVRVSDPNLKQFTLQEIVDDKTLFNRAAGVWYQNDRQKAQAKLSTVGYQSIEAEPQDLSAALVSAYLRVKHLNLL